MRKDFVKLGYNSLCTLFLISQIFFVSGTYGSSLFQKTIIGTTIKTNLISDRYNGFFPAISFQFAFPGDDDCPAFGFQLAPDFLVALLVAGYLGSPEVGVGFGDRVVLTVFVAVPKAAVDEDDGAVLGEDDVWLAGEAFVVDPIAEAQAPEGFAQEELRLGGGGVDGGHVAMALGRGVIIRHTIVLLYKATNPIALLQNIH